MGAGNYPDRMHWIRCERHLDNTTGQVVDSWPESVVYPIWGRIDLSNGRRGQDYGAEQTGADATITVRNVMPISALDRLYSTDWAETWVIDSVRRGDNETIIDAHKFDDLIV